MKSVHSHVALAKYAVLTVLITLLGGVVNPTASAAPEPGALPTAGAITVTPVTGDPALRVCGSSCLMVEHHVGLPNSSSGHDVDTIIGSLRETDQ